MLNWLPKDDSVPDRIRDISRNPNASWNDLCHLASCSLDFPQMLRLSRLIGKHFNACPEEFGTRPVKLAILGSATTSHLLPGIRVAGLRRNLWIEIYTGNYGQYAQDLADPNSPFFRFEPDAVLFVFDASALLGTGDLAWSEAEAGEAADNAVSRLRGFWRYALTATHGQVIQQTFITTAAALMGENEHKLPGSLHNLTALLNVRLRQAAPEEGVDLLSMDTRIARDGLSAWHDPAFWHHAKQEIAPAATPMYGDLVARLLGARLGRSAKCLVLDLDNTLWGGVVGDDGVANIALGQGSACGEAFVAFQRYVKGLSQRGIVLAVCSKNDEANALAPFESHAEMVLQRSDIACFVANWQDKPSNIRHIAAALNLGLDSLVFVDDNAFERNIVRRELPMVCVPELPSDPAHYAQCIADAGYFEAVAFTAEDFDRSKLYQSNAKRLALQASSTDLASYLQSLCMRLIWGPIDSTNLPRVTQLINKTNQFNLTTRRYSEQEVASMAADPRNMTLQCRLVDRLGDNGIIGVVITKADEAGYHLIDTWLMSCRVLGRQAEEAMLNVLVDCARAAGISGLKGEYIPTDKNGMVKDLFQRLGFSETAAAPDGRTLWSLNLGSFEPLPTTVDIGI